MSAYPTGNTVEEIRALSRTVFWLKNNHLCPYERATTLGETVRQTLNNI